MECLPRLSASDMIRRIVGWTRRANQITSYCRKQDIEPLNAALDY